MRRSYFIGTSSNSGCGYSGNTSSVPESITSKLSNSVLESVASLCDTNLSSNRNATTNNAKKNWVAQYPTGWGSQSLACRSFCEKIDEFKYDFSSFLSMNEMNQFASKFFIFIVSYWQRNATARFIKLNYLPRTYSKVINDDDFIIYIYRKLSNNTPHIQWDPTLECILKQTVSNLIRDNSTIAYKKVSLLRSCLISNIHDMEFDKRNLTKFLGGARLFFLLKETNVFKEYIKQDVNCARSYFYNFLYSNVNLDSIEMELEEHFRKSFKIYSHPLTFYYPRFIRDIIEKYFNSFINLSDYFDSIDFDHIKKEAEEYFNAIGKKA